jgi:hypothetical protein
MALMSFLALAAWIVVVSPASAAVTIGQTFAPTTDFGGAGVFVQLSSPDDIYTVPSDGVITSWSFEAAAGATPPLKLKVVRHVSGNDYLTVGDSQLQTPVPSMLNTWQTRIPVKAGDFPGEYYSDTTFAYRNLPGFSTTEIAGAPGDPAVDPPPGTTTTFEPPSGSPHQIDLSAVLESDADQDGFGDETQDKCLGTAGSYSGCPNTIKVTKLKQKGTKLKVTVVVPGAGTLAVGSPTDKALTSGSAKDLKSAKVTLTQTTASTVTVKLKLTKSAIGRLRGEGSFRAKVKAVYTPPGGPPGSRTKKKKLG